VQVRQNPQNEHGDGDETPRNALASRPDASFPVLRVDELLGFFYCLI
jgi:hypothetical protein